MNLSDRQWQFLKDVALLILYADARGMKLTGGTLYRDPDHNRAVGGIEGSLHTERLAVDLNLFDGSVYLPDTADHKPLGEFWESLRPENRWGGRFNDGNHYERYR